MSDRYNQLPIYVFTPNQSYLFILFLFYSTIYNVYQSLWDAYHITNETFNSYFLERADKKYVNFFVFLLNMRNVTCYNKCYVDVGYRDTNKCNLPLY